jgi:hypothetical protein
MYLLSSMLTLVARASYNYGKQNWFDGRRKIDANEISFLSRRSWLFCKSALANVGEQQGSLSTVDALGYLLRTTGHLFVILHGMS